MRKLRIEQDTIEFTQGDAIFIPAVPLTYQRRFRRARVRVLLPPCRLAPRLGLSLPDSRRDTVRRSANGITDRPIQASGNRTNSPHEPAQATTGHVNY
jgi:hypothetical protein